MPVRLTTAQRLLGAALVTIASVATAGVVGFWMVETLDDNGAESARAASAIRLQMQADMAHDALRGDVLAAMLGGMAKDAAKEKEVRDDLAEHGGRFRESMKELSGIHVDPEVDVAVAKVQPLLDAYLKEASAMASLAFADLPAAEARMTSFVKSFKDVEQQMEQLSDLIESHAKQAHEDSVATTRQAHVLIVAGTVVAALLIGGMGLWNWRYITRQLGGEPQDVAQVATAIASGDLTTPMDTRHARPGSIVAAMAAMQESLRTLVSTVRESSESIAVGSKEIANGNADLSHRTEAQASSLEETAASMEQMGTTVQNNASTARQAAQLAIAASEVATHGGQAVDKVVQTMDAISASSRKIANIIGVIDGIAFQTNILALNAAVEAARAGEQGRGFAVVAGEVRSLAQRSAAAAREVKELIEASVADVEAGSRQVGDAGGTMDEIVNQVKRVNDLIAEISAATQQQTAGIVQVGVAVSQLDETTQKNAALVEQSAAAANSLSQQAGVLVDTVRVFKLT